MATGPFSSPVAGLALQMAARNQQLIDRMPEMEANQRRLLNERLLKYGGNLGDYESYMDVGYAPTLNAMRSQAEGMRDYVVGLPELMEKAAKEGTGSGTQSKGPSSLPELDINAQIEKGRQIAQARDSFRPVNVVPSPQAETSYRPRPQGSRLRPVRGNF